MINTNPTGLFPISEENGALTGYKLLKNAESLTAQGSVVVIPVKDFEQYLPSEDVLDPDHVDADYRYLLLGIHEVASTHHQGLASADKPKNYGNVEGGIKTTPAGKLNKEFSTRFWYDPSSLKLAEPEE